MPAQLTPYLYMSLLQRLTLILSCPMDLKNFPMDMQICTMQLESCKCLLLTTHMVKHMQYGL